MYINAVLFGVLATLFVEMFVVLAVILYAEFGMTSKRNHNNPNKGGK